MRKIRKKLTEQNCFSLINVQKVSSPLLAISQNNFVRYTYTFSLFLARIFYKKLRTLQFQEIPSHFIIFKQFFNYFVDFKRVPLSESRNKR